MLLYCTVISWEESSCNQVAWRELWTCTSLVTDYESTPQADKNV